MAFRPNYRLDRVQRDRDARSKAADKQRKREEKSNQRKAAREAESKPPAGDEPL